MSVDDGVEFLNLKIDPLEKRSETPVCVRACLCELGNHFGICLQFHIYFRSSFAWTFFKTAMLLFFLIASLVACTNKYGSRSEKYRHLKLAWRAAPPS
jgi:hypothetical protein